MADGPPLDFSYRGLRSLEDARARGPRRRALRPCRRSAAGLYRSRTLRLAGNRLASLRGLSALAFQVLDQPELLTWLDLSFNVLTDLSPELGSFSSLKILYLHGNMLSELPPILLVLQPLAQLYNLTLHGNPVENKKEYRQTVISTIKQLRCLDFINVTNSDRQLVSIRYKRK